MSRNLGGIWCEHEVLRMDDSRLARSHCGSIAIELTNSAIPVVLVNVELKGDGLGAGGSSIHHQTVSQLELRAKGDK